MIQVGVQERQGLLMSRDKHAKPPVYFEDILFTKMGMVPNASEDLQELLGLQTLQDIWGRQSLAYHASS